MTNFLTPLYRLTRYRLVIPLLRGRHSPQYTARGVGLGMFWAMTPFFGAQMLLVTINWLIARKLFSWDFSLANGIAWVWVSNVFTIIPLFFGYLITGQFMLGDHASINGYGKFVDVWTSSFSGSSSLWEGVANWFAIMVNGWGLPILIGSIPWSIILAIASYHLSLNFMQNYQRRRYGA